MNAQESNRPETPWRGRLYDIIFEADTPAGKGFDVLLIIVISMSVIAVIIESVPSIRANLGHLLINIEWGFTFLFTIEYVLRLFSVKRPLRYAVSFFGVIDLLAILPTYLSVVIAGSQALLTIRILRLLRIFRIFKLTAYMGEASLIIEALRASRRKISVFLFAVINVVVFIASCMYVIEGSESGFVDIPTSIYWAIVTLTTVGYGDISPATPFGKFLASFIMILGYGIIAVPTGIVTVEMGQAAEKSHRKKTSLPCPSCGLKGHDTDARFCKNCGHILPEPAST